METIKDILIRRDNLTPSEADSLIAEANEMLLEYLANDQQAKAYNICQEYFGLEPDYLDELLF